MANGVVTPLHDQRETKVRDDSATSTVKTASKRCVNSKTRRCVGWCHRRTQAVALEVVATQREKKQGLCLPDSEVGGSRMKSCLSRTVIAIGLGVSLWFTGIAALAGPVQAQDQSQSQKQSAPQQTAPKDQKSQGADQQQTASQPSRKTLPTGEDPTMIGKRNINKGIWAGGILGAKGIESEVRLGRQLAAEVDKEAKFVDDPIITEYVNRVGQKIVLHSDAKVPFTIKVIDSDEVNAFALPGGFFYVNEGLLLAADN